MDDTTVQQRKLVLEQLRILFVQYGTEGLVCPYKLTDFEGLSVEELRDKYDTFLLSFIELKEESHTRKQLGSLHSYLSLITGSDFTMEKFDFVWEKLYADKTHPEFALVMDCVDKAKLSALIEKSLQSKEVSLDILSLLSLWCKLFPTSASVPAPSYFGLGPGSLLGDSRKQKEKEKSDDCTGGCSDRFRDGRTFRATFVEKPKADESARVRYGSTADALFKALFEN